MRKREILKQYVVKNWGLKMHRIIEAIHVVSPLSRADVIKKTTHVAGLRPFTPDCVVMTPARLPENYLSRIKTELEGHGFRVDKDTNELEIHKGKKSWTISYASRASGDDQSIVLVKRKKGDYVEKNRKISWLEARAINRTLKKLIHS